MDGNNTYKKIQTWKEKYGVELPIIETVNEIIKNKADAKKAVYALMTREKKDEIEF